MNHLKRTSLASLQGTKTQPFYWVSILFEWWCIVLHCKTTDLPTVKSQDSTSNSKDSSRASQISIKKLVFRSSSEKSPLSNPIQWSNTQSTPQNWFSPVSFELTYTHAHWAAAVRLSYVHSAHLTSKCTVRHAVSRGWGTEGQLCNPYMWELRGACSHMNKLNKSDHIYMGSYKNTATWERIFAVIKGTILHWNCWIQLCHAHSLANSLCDNEHSLAN